MSTLKQKLQVVSNILISTVDIYRDDLTTESQRGLMETLIGAAIWYMPNKDLFSGYISRNAYEAFKRDPYNTKLVEEHPFPRKIAGQKLYTEYFDLITKDGHGLEKLYIEKFGKFNLVLKEENLLLKKFQKSGVFEDEVTSYASANIELIEFSKEDYEAYKKMRNKKRK